MQPTISVVVPAHNEVGYIKATLEHVRTAAALLTGSLVEIIVVDNASTDGTAAQAAEHGATVVTEPVRNIARVRNAGARASHGTILLFLDADTLLPQHSLVRLHEKMSDARCAGGTFDLDYRPKRLVMRLYLAGWRFVGNMARLAQGAAQFCRRDVFEALGGYDETIFNGEDVDFFLRLRKVARRRRMCVAILRDVVALPSARRFDKWPLWRVLVWTNPLFVLLFRRRRSVWAGWLSKPVR